MNLEKRLLEGKLPPAMESLLWKLNDTEICMRCITPAIERAGWDVQRQVRREFSFTDGRIIVRGKMVARGKRKRADYLLYWKKSLPIAQVSFSHEATLVPQVVR